MDTKFLLKVLSEFDMSYKYFRITLKNQINRNYGHFYWIIYFIMFSINLINILNLWLISDNDEDGHMKLGSVGFNFAGTNSRLMIDLADLSFYS